MYDRRAMAATNLLNLASLNPALIKRWTDRMVAGVPRGSRDDLDLAGKLPLCFKALRIGIDPAKFMIDCAQAGGVYGRNDGCILGQNDQVEPIEVKGGICRKGKKNSFFFNKIRSAGADWRHLFFLGRLRNPCRGDTLADVEHMMYLGYIRRDMYDRALSRSARSSREPMSVSISPASTISWLGKHVKWIKLSDLTKEWWDQHVIQGCASHTASAGTENMWGLAHSCHGRKHLQVDSAVHGSTFTVMVSVHVSCASASEP